MTKELDVKVSSNPNRCRPTFVKLENSYAFTYKLNESSDFAQNGWQTLALYGGGHIISKLQMDEPWRNSTRCY